MAPSIHADQVELYYEVAGAGPALLFLHGFQLDHEVMKLLSAPLAQSYRTVVLDLPGHGRSGEPAAPPSYDSMIREIVTLMDRLAIESAVVLGYSLGGQLALKLASLHPERVRGLVLIGTGFRYGTATTLVCRSGKTEELIRKVKEVKEKYAQVIWEKKERVGAEVRSAISAELNRFDFGPEAETVKDIPALILAGEIDKYFPEEIQRAMHRTFEKAELHILSDCGHGVIIENTQGCLEPITRFLAGMPL